MGPAKWPISGLLSAEYPMSSVDLRVPAPPHVRATAGPRRATPPPQGIHATTPRASARSGRGRAAPHAGARDPPAGRRRMRSMEKDGCPEGTAGSQAAMAGGAAPEAPSWPRLGSARLGSARLGSARLGSARLGSARLGSARLGSARLGLEEPTQNARGMSSLLSSPSSLVRPPYRCEWFRPKNPNVDATDRARR